MDKILKNFFDQKVGEFLKVDKENVQFNPGSGQISLKKAEVRGDVFDELHLPVTLRGGFIDEMSFSFTGNVFSSGGAKVVINRVFLVFGPQRCDWSWNQVYKCKTRLVELIMKIYDIKPAKKKKSANQGGWLAEFKARLIEDVKKKFLGALEVHISSIHFRYEDADTQRLPFACGFKIGSIEVRSDAKPNELRTRGEWKHSTGRHRDLFFCQSIHARRVSAYWDVDKDPSRFIIRNMVPAGGREVYDAFCYLNRRETFSVCVVEKLLEIYKEGDRRRKQLEGPTFRQRLDFHQYLMFPAGLTAHVTVNRPCEATRLEKAPSKDADVVFDPLELSIDSDQVQSMNELMSYVRDFYSKDKRFLARPQEPLNKYLNLPRTESERNKRFTVPASRTTSSGSTPTKAGRFGTTRSLNLGISSPTAALTPPVGSSSERSPSPREDPMSLARYQLVREWWQYAFQGVCLLCKIPKSQLDQNAVRKKARLREEYIDLCIEELDAIEEDKNPSAKEKSGPKDLKLPGPKLRPSKLTHTTSQLREMQMGMPMKEILDWRLLARARRMEQKLQRAIRRPSTSSLNGKEAVSSATIPKQGTHSSVMAGQQADDDDEADEGKAREEAEKDKAMPNSLQVHLRFKAFQGYFLIVADALWHMAIKNSKVISVPSCPPSPNPQSSVTSMAPSIGASAQTRRRRWNAGQRPLTRQLVVRGHVKDVWMDVVQRGVATHRVARWVELGIGSVNVTNCSIKKQVQGYSRQMLSCIPFDHSGTPTCLHISATTLEVKDSLGMQEGDVPLGAVLEPWEGIARHLGKTTEIDERAKVERLGFLKDHVEKEGKLMLMVFLRLGQVRAIDYTPFRRRLMHFLRRGNSSQTNDLERRPSPLALDRELLVRLQRKVQSITGNSNMLGVIEGVADGVRARLVDHYNSQNVLCKEVSLAPMRWKALRNGNPQTFHVQFHQLTRPEELPVPSPMGGDLFGLLPWKVAMLLLPKADFAMELSTADDGAGDELAGAHRSDVSQNQGFEENAEAVCEAVVKGAKFLKWGRNGRSKQRFVFFDESSDALVWKNDESEKKIIGAIPLSAILDICTGVQTPVLKKAPTSKLRPDCVLSIVSQDRTLDLQAENVMQQQVWVSGLKVKYRMHIQREGVDAEAQATELKGKPTKNRDPRYKSYPAKYRTDRDSLRSTYRKLQSFTALGKTLQMTQATTSSKEL